MNCSFENEIFRQSMFSMKNYVGIEGRHFLIRLPINQIYCVKILNWNLITPDTVFVNSAFEK